jgi:hypothetical protein
LLANFGRKAQTLIEIKASLFALLQGVFNRFGRAETRFSSPAVLAKPIAERKRGNFRSDTVSTFLMALMAVLCLPEPRREGVV